MSRDARITEMLAGMTEPALKEIRELLNTEIARLRAKIKQDELDAAAAAELENKTEVQV